MHIYSYTSIISFYSYTYLILLSKVNIYSYTSITIVEPISNKNKFIYLYNNLRKSKKRKKYEGRNIETYRTYMITEYS